MKIIEIKKNNGISGDRDNPSGYMWLAAIEERVYTRSGKWKLMTFYLWYPLSAISVLDTLKCS